MINNFNFVARWLLIEGTVKESNILLRRSALPLDSNKGGLMEYIIKDSVRRSIEYVVRHSLPQFSVVWNDKKQKALGIVTDYVSVRRSIYK